MRTFIRIRHVLMGDIAAFKVLKNAQCFILGYLVAMEHVICHETRVRTHSRTRARTHAPKVNTYFIFKVRKSGWANFPIIRDIIQ